MLLSTTFFPCDRRCRRDRPAQVRRVVESRRHAMPGACSYCTHFTCTDHGNAMQAVQRLAVQESTAMLPSLVSARCCRCSHPPFMLQC